MDLANVLWLDSEPDDNYWETYHRRGDIEGDWVRDFYDVSEMFDGNENAWSDLGRHERLAEAMYD
jgi:hypothetical protein|tara:strand:- start:293 stop:487 length:195 start_codon:yes stop_codon:yes gene_type:complete